MSDKTRIVIVNASLHGDTDNSNTLFLLRKVEQEFLNLGAEVVFISPKTIEPYRLEGTISYVQSHYVLDTHQIIKEVSKADGIIFGTGTYWGQSSSVLQKFIEDTTYTEGTDVWLGKPIGILVTEHSQGGQIVLSNLMMTFNNFGATIPAQSGLVISRTGLETMKHGGDWMGNIGGLEDIPYLCSNVYSYASMKERANITSWPIGSYDEAKLNERWLKD